MTITAVFYERPYFGKMMYLDITDIKPKDEKWFVDNHISIAIEEGWNPTDIIIYGRTPFEYEERPIESILIWDTKWDFKNAMTELRYRTKALLEETNNL